MRQGFAASSFVGVSRLGRSFRRLVTSSAPNQDRKFLGWSGPNDATPLSYTGPETQARCNHKPEDPSMKLHHAVNLLIIIVRQEDSQSDAGHHNKTVRARMNSNPLPAPVRTRPRPCSYRVLVLLMLPASEFCAGVVIFKGFLSARAVGVLDFTGFCSATFSIEGVGNHDGV